MGRARLAQAECLFAAIPCEGLVRRALHYVNVHGFRVNSTAGAGDNEGLGELTIVAFGRVLSPREAERLAAFGSFLERNEDAFESEPDWDAEAAFSIERLGYQLADFLLPVVLTVQMRPVIQQRSRRALPQRQRSRARHARRGRRRARSPGRKPGSDSEPALASRGGDG